MDDGEEGGREIVGAKEGGEGGGRRRCGCEAIAAIVGVCGVDGVIDGCIGYIVDRCIGCIVDRCIGCIVDRCIGNIVDRCIGCIVDRCIGNNVDRCIGYIVDRCIGYIVDDGSIIVDGCADERIVRDSDWSITDTIALDDGYIN